MKALTAVLFWLLIFEPSFTHAAFGHHPSIVKEYEQVFTTYPYSDPDPVPTMSRFYPYFRYDGFTEQPVQKKWKVVELSNEYLRVLILPEIGGKVWAAIDKSTGKSFIYFNHVVKFRDVSMRGPWTSGGIEPNYGIMGHTPNCFSPVDYLARRNPDGSASCFIGVLDLLTRSTWRLEINLPADQACFTTRSLWHNGSPLEQPYYTWMNVGIKATGNLEFISPGTQYLGHDGTAAPWPVDAAGHQLAWYEDNNFGSYKSYHVFGRLAEFFGGYWHDEDFGMAHYAPYWDKPGRKLWIWGLSGEGMIWEHLLTDSDGQYVEVQSGRLFNQSDANSSLTPFKHRGFPPFATDTWHEYWFAVKGTAGFMAASPWGAMNVVRTNEQLTIRVCPVRPLHGQLEVFDGERRLYAQTVQLHPMQPIEQRVKIPGLSQKRQLKVCVGGDKLQYEPAEDRPLSRPAAAPADFDWNSAYGLYLKGKESARQRAYPEAETNLLAAVSVEPHFVPALVELAGLANSRGESTTARQFALRALAVDTYDPEANYELGLASVALGRQADAQDAFSIASQGQAWRSAAYLQLAKVFLRERHYERALASVEESLANDTRNVDALQLRVCVYRLKGEPAKAQSLVKALLELDPLNHFARFEQYLAGKLTARDFSGSIRAELPQETFLELALWCHDLGLDSEAGRVLELAPATAEVLYWQAYLACDTNRLGRAEAASPEFVFPFRPESIPVFEWAAQHSHAWQPQYYLALLRWSLGQLTLARELLKACGEEPQFAPFYAARAQVDESNAEADLQRAAQFDPSQWRYGASLVRCLLKNEQAAAALTTADTYAARFPANGVVAVLNIKALMANGRYAEAAQLLDGLNLLPSEGSTEAHALFREANLMLAVDSLKAKAFARAEQLIQKARQWPERLGAGQPYPEDIDGRLEDWLTYECELGSHEPERARQTLDRLLAWRPRAHARNINDVVRALALKERGNNNEAQHILADWPNDPAANAIVLWGREVLAGHPAALPLKLQEANYRVLTGWLSYSSSSGQ